MPDSLSTVPTTYEVELKYRLDDATTFCDRLAAEGFPTDDSSTVTTIEVDTYYRHPVRDFAATDEAFRVRRSTRDGVTTDELTYKGPREAGPVKSREELVVRTQPGDEHALPLMLARLSFDAVATVTKRRQSFTRDDAVTVVIDEVEHVGCYVEIERIVAAEAGDDAARETATRQLLTLAASLGLPDEAIERRSYLELLLATTADNMGEHDDIGERHSTGERQASA